MSAGTIGVALLVIAAVLFFWGKSGYNSFTTIYAVPTHPVPKTLGNRILHFSVIK